MSRYEHSTAVVEGANADLQHRVVAAAAFDRTVRDRFDLDRTDFSDPAALVVFDAQTLFYKQHPNSPQAGSVAFKRFICANPLVAGWFGPETIQIDDLNQYLDCGNQSIDYIAGDVAALRELSFEGKWKEAFAKAESLPRTRRVEQVRDWLAQQDRLNPGGMSLDTTPIEIVGLSAFRERYPARRDPVIDGLFRRGDVANIVAKSKVGKSWTGYGMALSVITGRDWLGFPCRPGRVLLIDNELHGDDLSFRLPTVAEAMGLRPADYEGAIDLVSLRGRLRDIHEIGSILNASIGGRYSLIIIDALYRMYPAGAGENDNAAFAQLYNHVDRYAADTGAAIVLIHHATKGLQSDKDVTDVGAGGGAQSRAADAHIVLRPHEDADCVVMDAAVRSFAPPEPRVLRWTFPLWSIADDLDPDALKGTKTAKANEAKDKRLDEKRNRVVAFLGRSENRARGATQTAIKNGTGISVGLLAVLNSLVDDENLVVCEIIHPKNKSSQSAWMIRPDKSAERLKDESEGLFSVLQSGSNPPAEGRIPLKGEFRPPADAGLPKSLKDGFPPEDDTTNQSAKTSKRKARKPAGGRAS